MPVRGLTSRSSAGQIVDALITRHPNHLSPKIVKRSQLNKLVTKMIDKLTSSAMRERGGITAAPPPIKSAQPAAGFDGDTNLNKLSHEEIVKAKGVMNETFVENQVKPGDAAFQYDKRVEFKQPAAASEWDDDLEVDSDLDSDDFDPDDLVF
ncbi:hypothetical protein PROFUN_12296 [Planoprotostelium fungivorum]|uniref:Centrosomal protein of 19 kDa n=1 Tax=Planoprotostelium fungivorum TaxID=1890364 RepID=A0A2P6N7T8_9EUKA|nr:hypothetical protein PROFUN_12296 [Planoprotostelium fungivorum]